jgi:hypothetical protein
MSLDDLSFALNSEGEPSGQGLAGLQADVDCLTDLTLLAPGPEIQMHPWTSALVTRTAAGTAALHERALAMRHRRFHQNRTNYDDFIDIPRHLAALGRFDAVANGASDTVGRFLKGTLAICAYLAEVRSMVPQAERAWGVIADLEIGRLLDSGDSPSAMKLARLTLHENKRRARTDPGNAGWQRDLSVSHDRLGDMAMATGDMPAARNAYTAALAISQRLADADPGNADWQRDLSVSQMNVGNVALRARDFAAARSAFEASLTISTRLAALDPSNAQWRNDLQWVQQKLDDLEK